MASYNDNEMLSSYISCLVSNRKRPHFDEVAQSVTLLSCCCMLLVLLARPETHISVGPHQTIGDCDVVTYTHTITGMVCKGT